MEGRWGGMEELDGKVQGENKRLNKAHSQCIKINISIEFMTPPCKGTKSSPSLANKRWKACLTGSLRPETWVPAAQWEQVPLKHPGSEGKGTSISPQLKRGWRLLKMLKAWSNMSNVVQVLGIAC